MVVSAAATVSSQVVNVADDAEIRLVRLLTDMAPVPVSSTFLSDCTASMDAADAVGLLRTILQDQGAMGAFFQMESMEEAISAFSLLTALLGRAEHATAMSSSTTTTTPGTTDDHEWSQSLANAIVTCQVSTKEEGDMAMRRIMLLSALYNVRSSGTEKCTLLHWMIRLAAAHQPKLLAEDQALGKLLLEDEISTTTTMTCRFVPPVPRIVSMLNAWQVPLVHRRELFVTIAEQAFPDMQHHPRKQRFQLLLIETYRDKSQMDELGFNAAKEAAIGAIRDPVSLFMYQRNMLSLVAIQELANNNETKSLHGLLSVFLEGKLDDYDAFVKENGGEAAVLETWNLSPEQCRRHMRILSLCSLGAEHEEIPYKVVATTLQLPSEDQVESWVIAAVSTGLLTAKMDQLEQKIMVEKSVVRKFDLDHWKVVQTRLNVWKENVGAILQAFKQSQAAATLSTTPV